jgi:hypothetical protein
MSNTGSGASHQDPHRGWTPHRRNPNAPHAGGGPGIFGSRPPLGLPVKKHSPVRRGTTFVTRFHPGVAHDHKPTGRWADVQKDATSRCKKLTEEIKNDPKKLATLGAEMGVECACAILSPELVAATARRTVMMGLPLAQQHLDHYLEGTGSAIIEDVENLINSDSKVRAKLAASIKKARVGFIRIEQSDYAVKDFQFAFGAIDRMDFEVDRASGLVHIWFQDRYEWHPVGFGYTRFPGDIRRETNCVHAALVELKASGAKDFWMIGDVVVPLSEVTGPPVTGIFGGDL